MAGILGEYTEVFLEESEDQIEELNANLLRLEKDHDNPEIINDIFRAAHSLKSSSAFVGLYNLSDLSHKMENLLQKIREGSLEINVTLVNLLFECFGTFIVYFVYAFGICGNCHAKYWTPQF